MEEFHVNDRIVCISEGYMFVKGKEYTVTSKSFSKDRCEYRIVDNEGNIRHLRDSVVDFKLVSSKDERFLNSL